jgi:hypothetical protein
MPTFIDAGSSIYVSYEFPGTSFALLAEWMRVSAKLARLTSEQAVVCLLRAPTY